MSAVIPIISNGRPKLASQRMSGQRISSESFEAVVSARLDALHDSIELIKRALAVNSMQTLIQQKYEEIDSKRVPVTYEMIQNFLTSEDYLSKMECCLQATGGSISELRYAYSFHHYISFYYSV